eukprot:6366410-Pyramimonas_sp.AAC.1
MQSSRRATSSRRPTSRRIQSRYLKPCIPNSRHGLTTHTHGNLSRTTRARLNVQADYAWYSWGYGTRSVRRGSFLRKGAAV